MRRGCARCSGRVGSVVASPFGTIISDTQSENNQDGDECRQPGPHRSATARRFKIEATGWVGAARVGVVRVRHVSSSFRLTDAMASIHANDRSPTMFTGKVPTSRNPDAQPTQSRFESVIADGVFAIKKQLLFLGIADSEIPDSDHNRAFFASAMGRSSQRFCASFPGVRVSEVLGSGQDFCGACSHLPGERYKLVGLSNMLNLIRKCSKAI